MSSYILSILGIVLAGIMIDVIIPSGHTSKFIKSIYSLFVVAILIAPAVKFIAKHHDIDINFQNYEINEKLSNYINKNKIIAIETDIKNKLENEGFKNIDIKINYSFENSQLNLISAEINIENMEILDKAQHINKYEFIKTTVNEFTGLTDGEIIFYE